MARDSRSTRPPALACPCGAYDWKPVQVPAYTVYRCSNCSHYDGDDSAQLFNGTDFIDFLKRTQKDIEQKEAELAKQQEKMDTLAAQGKQIPIIELGKRNKTRLELEALRRHYRALHRLSDVIAEVPEGLIKFYNTEVNAFIEIGFGKGIFGEAAEKLK